jgi:hypothetical protein
MPTCWCASRSWRPCSTWVGARGRGDVAARVLAPGADPGGERGGRCRGAGARGAGVRSRGAAWGLLASAIVSRVGFAGRLRPRQARKGAAEVRRILHVFGVMDRAARRRAPSSRCGASTATATPRFLTLAGRPGAYDGEIAALGGRGSCPPARRRRSSAAGRAIAGAYDVVHSHVHHFSGMVRSRPSDGVRCGWRTSTAPTTAMHRPGTPRLSADAG